jgi:L,D-transpeptidase catalytic domain
VGAGARSRARVGWHVAVAVLMGLAIVLSACAPDPAQGQAQRNRAQLDAELHHAQQLGIPATMLQPVVTDERKTASGAGGWGYSYKNAATSYAALYTQLMQVEQQSTGILMQEATNNIGIFSTLVAKVQQQGFTEASAYQQRLDNAKQQLSSAKTPDQIAQVSQYALMQAQALQAMGPTYDQLVSFRSSVDSMQKVGITSSWADSAYTQDLTMFRAASTPQSYTHLQQMIGGQTAQLTADSAQAAPYVLSTTLNSMQQDIDNLKTYGEQTATFQSDHDADVQALAQARSTTDYLTLLRNVASQRDQMALPLARGKARYDIQALNTLVQQEAAKDPNLDYEYADPNTGIGDVQGWFDQAPLQNYDNPTCGWDVVCRYGQVDNQAVQMLTNLRAMVQNLNDHTPASQPHATDLQLMQTYGFMTGQVTVVSLREQVARAYQDGKLVYWSYITTGRVGLPTPPGVQYTVWKGRNVTFMPLGPIGPANGYPTLIYYAVNFTSPYWHQFVGYFLHDAWWRLKFGPGSNFPHYDPSAWNNGSHGCINFPPATMPAYYNWVQVGTPVIVY